MKTTLWDERWHKEFNGSFSCEQLEVQKFAHWLDPFVQSIQIFRQKSIEELCLTTLKNDAKFEEYLTLGSKNDTRNSVNFNASSGKSGNLHFDVLLLPMHIKFQPKKDRRMISHGTEKGSKLLRKTEKWHEEFDELSNGKFALWWTTFVESM